METLAVVLEAPETVALRPLELVSLTDDDLIVEIAFSGVSSGTEKLFFSGRMPAFPGMGYPLVPGYESVGRVVDAAPAHQARIGETVFVPGANCYRDAKGLFGGAARRVVVSAARALPIGDSLGERAVLLALAATAHHAIVGGLLPDLIIGHGVLGRLLARIAVAAGGAPVIWEKDTARAAGAAGYDVVRPEDDDRRNYPAIYDASGDAALLDSLIARGAKGGEIVLAGFYEGDVRFAFAPAFMRETRLRVAAEWKPDDLASVMALVETDVLSLDGLISHRSDAADAVAAYPTAFENRDCLKMVLDWRGCA
jgi:bacteriochlorophyllide a dehydrogenase